MFNTCLVLQTFWLLRWPHSVQSATTCFSNELRTNGAPPGCSPYAVYDVKCGLCGDDVCSREEDSFTCPADCGKSPVSDEGGCGNGKCSLNETCKTCPLDCGPCVFAGPYKHCVASAGRVLALTFDDGPTNTTPAVLDLLRKYNAKATFFNVATQTFRPLTTSLLAEGHMVGAHTHVHTALEESYAAVRNDTIAAERRIAQVIERRVAYMRPPFGRLNWPAHRALADLGYKIILWSAGTWPEDKAAVLASLRSRSSVGGIFMFHGEQEQHSSMETLEAILQTSKELNYRLVSLDECLGDTSSRGFKSTDGTCVDEGCQCTSTAHSLPHNAGDICYNGDLSSVAAASVQAFSGQPGTWDHCHLAEPAQQPPQLQHRLYDKIPAVPSSDAAQLRTRLHSLEALVEKHQADVVAARDDADKARQSALKAQATADKLQETADKLQNETAAATEENTQLRGDGGRARNEAQRCTSELQLATTMQAQCAQQLGECNEASVQNKALEDACALLAAQQDDAIALLAANNARLTVMVKVLVVVVVCLGLGFFFAPTLRRQSWKSYA
eukprot:m.78483 g.78483  ORF g.78483 m.78483 type:complete len:557 (+) comp16233_c1_seq5:244-1914(+)